MGGKGGGGGAGGKKEDAFFLASALSLFVFILSTCFTSSFALDFDLRGLALVDLLGSLEKEREE